MIWEIFLLHTPRTGMRPRPGPRLRFKGQFGIKTPNCTSAITQSAQYHKNCLVTFPSPMGTTSARKTTLSGQHTTKAHRRTHTDTNAWTDPLTYTHSQLVHAHTLSSPIYLHLYIPIPVSTPTALPLFLSIPSSIFISTSLSTPTLPTHLHLPNVSSTNFTIHIYLHYYISI